METDQNAYPRRKYNRLYGFDYSSSSLYFVTIMTHNKASLFGHIANNQVILNKYGKIAQYEWVDTPNHHSAVKLHSFAFMPNHLHAIIELTQSNSIIKLSSVIGGYKSQVTRRIRKTAGDCNLIVWQYKYYDHVVRDEADYNRIEAYIKLQLDKDQYYDDLSH